MKKKKTLNIKSAEFAGLLSGYLTGEKVNENVLWGVIYEACHTYAVDAMYKTRLRVKEATDIAQDVFEKLFQGGINKYDPNKSSISNWLRTVVRNEVINNYRKESKETVVSYDDFSEHEKETTLESVPHEEVQEDWVTKNINAMKTCMHVLNENEDLVINMILQGMTSMKEIGVELGKSGDWVSAKKFSAIRKIEKEMKRRNLFE